MSGERVYGDQDPVGAVRVDGDGRKLDVSSRRELSACRDSFRQGYRRPGVAAVVADVESLAVAAKVEALRVGGVDGDLAQVRKDALADKAPCLAAIRRLEDAADGRGIHRVRVAWVESGAVAVAQDVALVAQAVDLEPVAAAVHRLEDAAGVGAGVHRLRIVGGKGVLVEKGIDGGLEGLVQSAPRLRRHPRSRTRRQ